ncbi:MAG: hypothetical protein H7343_10210 [Undibacterium sp.]|nr:hypothetical protein [Opitutaceae bacterium]
MGLKKQQINKMASLRAYPFTIAPSSTVTMQISGKQVIAIECLFPFTLGFDGGAPVPFEKGSKVILPFDQLTLNNPSATTPLTVTLLAGDGDFQDYRPNLRIENPVTGLRLFSGAPANNGVIANAAFCEASNSKRAELSILNNAASSLPLSLLSGITGVQLIASANPGVTISVKFAGPVYVSANNLTDGGSVWATYYA